jgi:hypothetical protein
MQQYRVFKIGLDGHVFDRVDLTCSDENDAKKQAMALVEDHDMELWRLDKRIAICKVRTLGSAVRDSRCSRGHA